MSEHIKTQATKIKQGLTELCRQTLLCASKDDFPKNCKDVEQALAGIEDDTFDIVVCGEVKKGKSSLINAIIGEDILPVDIKVATAQAFRIVNSNEQSYYLVHTDGTKKPIAQEDLAAYGSQAVIDKNGEPITFDKIVDYMEVHVPIPFLPKSIVLVDTPGLGAIYANHATVTKRHLSKAAAVIFVMDPSNPLTDSEIEFLDQITAITPNVLLVMTKQDNYDDTYINTQINRNVEILINKGFGEKLSSKHVRIWPMSSSLLRYAGDKSRTEDDRDICYAISSFETIKSELLKMLEATIALSKNVVAFNSLNEYNNRVMTAIADMDTVLKSTDDGKTLLTKKQTLKAEFKSKWGAQGEEQRRIVSEVNNLIEAYAKKAVALFNPASDLYNKLSSEIDSLNDYNAAKSYAALFPKRMMTEYMQAWQGLNEVCASRIVAVMSRFREMIVADMNSVEELDSAVTLPPYPTPKFGVMDHFNFTKSGWFTLFFATSIFHITLASLVALPIAALIGWFTGNSAKLNKMKADLKGYLNTNLASLRNQVLTDPVNPNDKLSDSLFETTKKKHLNMAQEALKQIYDERLSATEEEINRINAQIEEQTTHRQEAAARLGALKAAWNPVFGKLGALRNDIMRLEGMVEAETNLRKQ